MNSNDHFGNLFFEEAIEKRRKEFALAGRNETKKVATARKVLDDVRSLDPPGRFLKKLETGKYIIQDENETLARIRQAFERKSCQKPSRPRGSKNEQEKVKNAKFNSEDGTNLLVKEIVEALKESDYLKKERIMKTNVIFSALLQLANPLVEQGEERNRFLIDLVKCIYEREDKTPLRMKKFVEGQEKSEYLLNQKKNPKAEVMFAALSQLSNPLEEGKERKRALIDIVSGICANDPFICTVVENEMKLTLDPVIPRTWNSEKALENTLSICCRND